MTAFTTIKQQISLTSLLYGLCGACVIYLLIFASLWIDADDIVHKLEEKLASETAEIERDYIPEADLPKPPEVTAHGIGHVETHAAVTPPSVQVHKKGKALIPAPVDGVYEKEGHDVLPVKAPNNLRPYDVYKKPFTTTGKPLIAIVVMNFGLDDNLSKTILEALPSEISLILSPYSNAPDQQQKEARARGHELWMNLPMETTQYPYKDPGPRGLLSNGGLKYNQDSLKWTLSRASGYAGVATFSDSAFDNSPTILKNIFEDVFSRGLGYLELNPQSTSSIETLALLENSPYARNVVSINDVSLKNLEKTAREKGFVVATFFPSPNGIQSLQRWTETLKTKGLSMAPLSAISDISINQK